MASLGGVSHTPRPPDFLAGLTEMFTVVVVGDLRTLVSGLEEFALCVLDETGSRVALRS